MQTKNVNWEKSSTLLKVLCWKTEEIILRENFKHIMYDKSGKHTT